jgi:two-component system LytT family sensor kinase
VKVWLKYSVLLVLSLAANGTLAQSKQDQDVNRATRLVDDANKKVISEPLDAFKLATDAVVQSKQQKDLRSEASAYNSLGTLYFNAGDYTKAIEYFNKAKVIYQKIKDEKSEEYTLKYLGKSYEAINDYKSSSSSYEQAEQKTNSSYRKTGYTISNSKIKKQAGRSKEAINDLEQELKYNLALDPVQKIDIYLELGDLYLAQKDTAQGVKLIGQALQNAKKTRNDSVGINTLNSAWNVYDQNGLTEINLETQQAYADSSRDDISPEVQRTINYNIGNTLLNTDAEKAKPFLEKSSAPIPDEEPSIDRIRAVEKLSQAYEKSGEYDKALAKYKEYIALLDSIKLLEMASRMQNEMLTTKYEIQETRIRELEEKQLEKEKSIRRQQWTIGLLVLGLALFAVLTYFLVKNIREKQESNMRIRLASLRSQMNPHFIFNSLNSVNGFISQNEERKANRYLADFSKLMRSVLNNSNNESIPLDEELRSLEIYLSLEHSRFPDKFDYQLDVDTDTQTQLITVPPMLIQPYIENAVWHGLRYRESKGLLLVSISQKDDTLIVGITDNGIGRKQSQQLKTTHQKDYKSTGMSHTQERLLLLNKLYKRHYAVTVTDLNTEGETGTDVELKLPIYA